AVGWADDGVRHPLTQRLWHEAGDPGEGRPGPRVQRLAVALTRLVQLGQADGVVDGVAVGPEAPRGAERLVVMLFRRVVFALAQIQARDVERVDVGDLEAAVDPRPRGLNLAFHRESTVPVAQPQLVERRDVDHV